MVMAKTDVSRTMQSAGYPGTWYLTIDFNSPIIIGGPYDVEPDVRDPSLMVQDWQVQRLEFWRRTCYRDKKWYWIGYHVVSLIQIKPGNGNGNGGIPIPPPAGKYCYYPYDGHWGSECQTDIDCGFGGYCQTRS